MFGPMLREWRQNRRYSQSQLAETAEVSTRHLSCLERGVSQPSRQMVLVLASALDIPLRERNTLLHTAGYSGAYRERDLDHADLAPVREALTFILDRTAPNPAVLVDRLWTVRKMNKPFQAILSWLLGYPIQVGFNLALLTVDPEGLAKWVVNREALTEMFIGRVRREAQLDNDQALHELADELIALSGFRGRAICDPNVFLLPVILEKDGLNASLFTTLTTLSTAMDVTLQELRIESYFPADVATADLVRSFTP